MNYTFPKKFVVIRTKDIVRNVTEEQREQSRQRLKQYNEAKRRAE